MTTPRERIGIQLAPLTQQQQQLAREELRETPENVAEAVVALRELLRADPTLHYRDDDDFLIRFLRPTKYYPKSAHELMKRAAVFKDKHSDLLRNLLPTDEQDAFVNHTVVNVLADRDHKDRRVLIVNCGGSWDPSKVTANQMFKLFYLIHEGAMLEPQTQVAGVVVIMDFKNMSLKQVRGLSPSFSMLLLSFIQDAMPLRLKEVHIVKQPYIFNMVFTMFKPFIREKLRNRMFFHGDKMESLHKHLDPSHLPEDYGGKLPKIDYTSKDWYPVICDITDEIKEWNSYGLVQQSK
ncbi:retinaldehyde-binding protein 1 [Schistocerca cancellata]|uniref:retinaldehyde-binding protein 1 n=1 Tax=Schistocerca cancellata TaxID=274614 RepID=UPI0021176600|nr:retinaldehyde-binding protein 1 [Schistocerca cancellata]